MWPMTVAQCLQRWRALPQAERQRRRWQRIPRHAAASMAFEGEPVELTWLQQLHRLPGPPNSQAVIGSMRNGRPAISEATLSWKS